MEMEKREDAKAAVWARSIRGGREKHPGTTAIMLVTCGQLWHEVVVDFGLLLISAYVRVVPHL